MELSPATADRYIGLSFSQMLAVADRLGDDNVNLRPLGPGTNAVAALIVHCCGVAEFWLGHVALGRPSDRDRASEFSTTATVADLHALVDATLATAAADLGRIEAGEGTDLGGRSSLHDGDVTDAAVVLHVLEETFQHLGHMELAADVLSARAST
jgi:uncharacterized damage-inducible protein DinB